MDSDNSAARVTQHLRRLAQGRAAGARLPSVRALMAELGVGPATVQAALATLGREGMIEARPGQGTFVASPPPPRLADLGWQSVALGPVRASPGALSSLAAINETAVWPLNAGYLPPTLQPRALLAAAAARALRRPGLWERQRPDGMAGLRAWFTAELGGVFQPHEAIICPGTQAATAAAFRALAQPGDPVLVESPTYAGALAAARMAGLRPVPVATDAEGLRPELLEEAFGRTGARLLYAQPTFANPTGALLAPSRRAAVLRIVRDARAFLIEDDWARDFALDDPAPPPPLAAMEPDGHVIYLRSLTKCAAPGLRIGAVLARGPALERLRATRLVDDFFVPGLLQEVALQVLTAPGWERHLRHLRAGLRLRRDALAGALRRALGPDCLPALPRGGLHLWVALPGGVSDEAVEAAAARRGLLVSAGHHWHPAEPERPFLRLSFAAAEPEAAEAAAAALRAALD